MENLHGIIYPALFFNKIQASLFSIEIEYVKIQIQEQMLLTHSHTQEVGKPKWLLVANAFGSLLTICEI